MNMTREKNREVILNFGIIAYGQLKHIEELQSVLEHDFEGKLKVIFQTVTAKRLRIEKVGNSEGDFDVNIKFEGVEKIGGR
jgi:hypothetical protein